MVRVSSGLGTELRIPARMREVPHHTRGVLWKVKFQTSVSQTDEEYI